MDYSNFLKQTLTHVSKIATEQFGHVSSSTKPEDSNQVLTEADLLIGKYIIEQIKKYFPGHNIIDEEAGIIDKKSDYTWVVDPIDGTSNFAVGIPLYGPYLGLLHGDKPIVGGLALPAFSEIYVAEKGTGAFCNDRQIFVTKETDVNNVLIAVGIDGKRDNPEQTRKESAILAEIILHCRNLRASNSAYDAAMVVKGSYGAWLNTSSKIWDNVALHVLTEEAGGVYTDFYGKPMDYSRPFDTIKKNFTYCATSFLLHAQLQRIIKNNS